MGIVPFERWCARAAGSIRIRSDREEVFAELYAHMEDQYEELLEAGCSEADAENEVVSAMGDPGETSRQLERIHRPFWGYALRAARWCLVLSVLLGLFFLPAYVQGLNIASRHTQTQDEAYFGESREEEECFDLLIFYTEVGYRDRSDGYTFTVTRAAERSSGFKEAPEDAQSTLYLEVTVFNPRPWADACASLQEFSAVDSLGNVYPSARYANRIPFLTGTWRRTGLFTYTWIIMLKGYRSREADWIELRYEKSGRDVRLPVSLRGRREAAS